MEDRKPRSFHIEPDIFEIFPGLLVIAALARGIDNQRPGGEVAAYLAEQMFHARERLAGGSVQAHPLIAPWRQAMKRMGIICGDERRSARLHSAGNTDLLNRINVICDLFETVAALTGARMPLAREGA